MKNDKAMKRKLLHDRTFPSADQIGKYQDFNRIQSDYGLMKKLLLKKVLLWSGSFIGAACVAGAILLNTGRPAVHEKPAEPAPATEACVQPPLPGAEPPFTAFRISAKHGGTVEYATGSSIVIPADAFVNGNGKPVGDSVEIRYREYHDPLSIFLSGIPMHYDSAGITRTFESAGMIEIRAFDGSDELTLKEGTRVHVRMATADNAARYNLYTLDTLQKNWVYAGKDSIEPITRHDHVRTASKGRQRQEEAGGNMIKPALSDPEKYSFRIAYDKTDFPELAAYDNVLFEVTDHDFKPAYFRINWKSISLYNGDEKGSYVVKLKKADTSISVNARPVFNKDNYSAALARFESTHRQMAMERDQKEMERQAALNKVNKELQGYSVNNVLATAESMARLTGYRNFTIRSMGYHNMDFPLPPIVQYAYSFQQSVQQPKAADGQVAYRTIFLVEKGKNAVFRFAKGEPVRCDPSAQNLMWTVTDNNAIAFFRISDYKKLVNGAENAIVPVPAKNQEMAFAEIRKFSE